MKLLADPMIAKIHIQKTAPGPPVRIAVATPAMFPTPIRAPIPMQNASKEETLEFFFPSEIPETESLEVSFIFVICRPFSLKVNRIPRPIRKTKAIPHR